MLSHSVMSDPVTPFLARQALRHGSQAYLGEFRPDTN